MNDRELLELAAKAIGMTLQYNYLGGRDANQPWDPLVDLGDRYQLMQLLRISVDFNDCCAWHRATNGDLIQEFWGGDCMDEEHAIVSVAAQLGRNKP